jgi:hypothetical protein
VTVQQAVQYWRVLLNSRVPHDRQVGIGCTVAGTRARCLVPRVWAAELFDRLSGVVSAILPGLLVASACATCSAMGAAACA